MNTFEQWADIIDELDAHPDLSGKSQDFIIDLVEQKPRYLSPKQVAWLENLKERYLA